MTVAYVGVGANLGDPRGQVEAALRQLDRVPGTRVTRRSSLYRTAPVGYAEQPDFVNAVAQLETSLPAERLLTELQAIEERHGRKRSFPNAPRTLDLDLLLYGDASFDQPGLTVPHPRMHERAFVLLPLVEIAPHAAVPGRGAAQVLAGRCVPQGVERLD